MKKEIIVFSLFFRNETLLDCIVLFGKDSLLFLSCHLSPDDVETMITIPLEQG